MTTKLEILKLLSKTSCHRPDDGYDVLLNGKRVGEVVKRWSRLGGEGWIVQFNKTVEGVQRSPSATQKNLHECMEYIAEQMSRKATNLSQFFLTSTNNLS